MRKSFLLASLLVLAACAPSTTIKTFVDPSLNIESIRASGISVMPTGLGKAVQDANIPELRRQLAQRVTESLNKDLAGVKIQPLVDTIDALQKANLTDNYASVLNGFEQTGLLNTDRMSEMAKVLSARYLLIPYLQSASSQTVYSGLSTSVNSSAAFSFVIWDSELKKSVFEGTGAGYATRTIFGGGNIIDAIYSAVDQASLRLKAGLGLQGISILPSASE